MNRVAQLRAQAEQCLSISRSMSLFCDAERLRAMAAQAITEAQRLEKAALVASVNTSRVSPS
jgi:hypothetical protein